jgi:hypothetical protein
MCWSFGASVIFTILGFIGSYILYRSKKYRSLWIVLFYFTIMELLQAATYPFIDGCSLPQNKILTLLGYFHIAFQPFFINKACMFFIPKHAQKAISRWVYSICFIGALVMLFKLIPFTFAGLCTQGIDILCGPNLCAATGSWHLAWFIPFNGVPNLLWLGYIAPVFGLPLLYGAWRPTIYHMAWAAFAWSLSSSPNERPAVWCLFSISLLMMVFYKPLLNWMYNKKWYFWNYPFKKSN